MDMYSVVITSVNGFNIKSIPITGSKADKMLVLLGKTTKIALKGLSSLGQPKFTGTWNGMMGAKNLPNCRQALADR